MVVFAPRREAHGEDVKQWHTGLGSSAATASGPRSLPRVSRSSAAAGVEFEAVDYDLGGGRYLRDGEILSDATLEEWRDLDAIYLGAVGTPGVPPGVIERGLLLKMRFELDLYINQRPFVSAEAGVDMTVIRENTEGTYAGEGGILRKNTPHEVATQGSVNTRMGVERAIRYAFELASTTARKHLTLCHKTNVLNFSGDLWQRTFDEVAEEFPIRWQRHTTTLMPPVFTSCSRLSNTM